MVEPLRSNFEGLQQIFQVSENIGIFRYVKILFRYIEITIAIYQHIIAFYLIIISTYQNNYSNISK